MRIVVTRPRAAGERTAASLRATGHDVLVAPLMAVEAIAASLDGEWSGIVITSANAPAAIAENPARSALSRLPVFAVGRRSAEAARGAGFPNVVSADGDVNDLVRVVAERSGTPAHLLYLAGEDRAGDLVAELASHRIAAEMRVVYRAVSAPFPSALIEALRNNGVAAVLHFSRRSAAAYVAGAQAAGLLKPALAVPHFCLSRQVAEPLAGAAQIRIAERPEEAALIALLGAPA